MQPSYPPSSPPQAQQRPPLLRTPRGLQGRPEPIIAGVCSGLSIHMQLPVNVVRIAITLLSLVFGVGVLIYLWLWIFVPTVSTQRNYQRNRLAPVQQHTVANKTNTAPRIIIGALFVAATFFLIAAGINSDPETGYRRFAFIAIAAGILLVWTQSTRIANWRDPSVIGLITAGTGILFWGIVMLLVTEGNGWRHFLTSFTAGVGFLIALTLAFFPAWTYLLRDLTSTQVERARETERADIAAHLHDSVLQTLTLIKNHANEPATVRSLAFTQERELRAWLYTGKNTVAESFSELLKTTISEIETNYGQEIDVVSVADCWPGPNEQAACAAAAEAAVNAIRHGAAPIQVYSEVSAKEIEIFVKDRGPGFELSEIAADRQGVRQSIIGRVERAGGKAEIKRLRPGTEIRIRVPRSST